MRAGCRRERGTARERPASASRGPTPVAPPRSASSAVVAVALVAVVAVTALAVARPWVHDAGAACPTPAEHPEWSVARRWDEALLDAIRRALPNPPVHARNLFHTSVAMWDAWAAYDPTANGYIVKEKADGVDDVDGGPRRGDQLRRLPGADRRGSSRPSAAPTRCRSSPTSWTRCATRSTVTTTDGDTPGRGRATGSPPPCIAYGMADGSNQANGYAAPDYKPVNDAARRRRAGHDDDGPQPLAAAPDRAHDLARTGSRSTNGVQQAVGPHWGHVRGLRASRTAAPDGVPMDPGPPPQLGGTRRTDQAYKDQAVEVIRRSSQLDAATDATIDISPGAIGDNTLGTNDGHGHAGQPGDRPAVRAGRRQAWATSRGRSPSSGRTARSRRRRPATGTSSPTTVSDELGADLRIGGTGAPRRPPAVGRQAVPRAQRRGPRRRDRRLGPQGPLRLRAADLDDPVPRRPRPVERPVAARPTTRRASRSCPGLVELITPETTAPGGSATPRSRATRARSRSAPGRATRRTRRRRSSGVGWILASNWVPYQLPTFVTPAFQGYVVGPQHVQPRRGRGPDRRSPAASTSRAASRVDDAQGRRSRSRQGPSDRRHARVRRPTTTPRTRPGVSRLYGGIHIPADDFNGRSIGSECGKDAWALAQQYYAGTAGS